MNARFEGFYERLESCPDRLKTHRCLRWDEKNKKVSSGSVTFMNKTMCFSFVFQEVLRV